jgi:hypothetical protein
MDRPSAISVLLCRTRNAFLRKVEQRARYENTWRRSTIRLNFYFYLKTAPRSTKFLQLIAIVHISSSSMQLSSMDDVSGILERLVLLSSLNVLCQIMLVTISYISRLVSFSGCVARHPNTVCHLLQQLCQVNRARLKEKLQDVDWMSMACNF